MKIWTIIGLLFFVAFLSSCQDKIEPLNDIDLSFYNEIHSEDSFSIWEMNEFPMYEYKMCLRYSDPDQEEGSSPCIYYPGQNVWIVEYKDQYYDISIGYTLGLYNTEDLIEYGVLFD